MKLKVKIKFLTNLMSKCIFCDLKMKCFQIKRIKIGQKISNDKFNLENFREMKHKFYPL